MMDEFAIHRAAKDGNLEMVRHLLEQRVTLDSRDDYGLTPLHWAADEGWCEVVQLLISNKCDLDVKDAEGQTPLVQVAFSGKKVVVDLLLKSGAQVNYADDYNRTLLHWASFNGWLDIVQRIVDNKGADLNDADTHGWTPFMFAVRQGHEDVAKLLVEAGTDIHRSDVLKRTALHLAAYWGYSKVVQVLLEQDGLDLNPQDKDGETPLHKACYVYVACKACYSRQDVVKQLLVAGADTAVKNNDGDTPLSLGIKENLPLEDIRLFLQRGTFFDDYDYALILRRPIVKETVLKDADLCTQSIVNKFHHQTLPALKTSIFAEKLPSIDKFKLNARQIGDVENFVRYDIQANTFCNIVKVKPMALSALCIQSLVAYLSTMK